MAKFQDLIGKRFNHLLVIFYKGSCSTGSEWWCLCQCGTVLSVPAAHLKSGHTKSCGCWKRQVITSGAHKTHGLSKTLFYKKWCGILIRCCNKNCKQYKYYGGRGIKCEWENFAEFSTDMYPSYLDHCKKYGQRETTLDRIDVNGNYSKENCRWATWAEQHKNKTTSVPEKFCIDCETKIDKRAKSRCRKCYWK